VLPAGGTFCLVTGTRIRHTRPLIKTEGRGALHPRRPEITISPGTVTGHAAAGGAFPADVDFLNRQTADFIDLVAPRTK